MGRHRTAPSTSSSRTPEQTPSVQPALAEGAPQPAGNAASGFAADRVTGTDTPMLAAAAADPNVAAAGPGSWRSEGQAVREDAEDAAQVRRFRNPLARPGRGPLEHARREEAAPELSEEERGEVRAFRGRGTGPAEEEVELEPDERVEVDRIRGHAAPEDGEGGNRLAPESSAADRRTRSVDAADGSLRMQSERRQTEAAASGTPRSTRTQTRVSVGDGLVQAQGTSERAVGEGDDRMRIAATAGVNAADRRLTLGSTVAQGPESDERRSVTREARITGTRDMDGVAGVEVRDRRSVGPESRRTTITSSLGYTADIQRPVGPIDDEDRYQVEGTLTWTGRFGASQSAGRQRELGASMHVGQRRRFTRVFPNGDAARDFHTDATRYFNTVAWTEFLDTCDSAQEAADMAVGESQAVQNEVGAEVSAAATIEGLRVGVTYGVTRQVEMEVLRSSEREVTVKFKNRTTETAGGTLGFGGATAGLSESEAALVGATVVYTIRDESGERGPGWDALEEVLNERHIPEQSSGPGWRISEYATGTERSTRASGSGLGASSSSRTYRRDERVTTTDADGRRETYERTTGGSEHRFTSGLPTWLVGGTALDDASEDYSFQTNNRQSAGGGGARLQATIDGAGAQESQERMAAATGTHTHTGVSGNDSGAWTLTANMSEEQLRSFCVAVFHGQWNPGLVGAAFVRAAERLRADIRAAGSMADARRAVRDYMAVTHERGFQQVEQVLGEDQLSWDVSLANSNVWEGSAGRERVQQQIENLERQLGAAEGASETSAALDAIEQAYRHQASRVHAMRDTSRFQELPRELRAEQVRLNEALLHDLSELRERAREAVRGQAQAGAEGEEPAAEGGDPGRLMASLRADERRLETTYRETLAVYQAVARERDIHQGRVRDRRATYIANEGGDEDHSDDWFRFGGPNRYERAGNHWRAGRRLWVQGDEAKHEQEDLSSRLPASGGPAEQIQAARRAAWRAKRTYARAAAEFRSQGEIYVAIRAHHTRSGDHGAYFGNTTFVLPESSDSGDGGSAGGE